MKKRVWLEVKRGGSSSRIARMAKLIFNYYIKYSPPIRNKFRLGAQGFFYFGSQTDCLRFVDSLCTVRYRDFHLPLFVEILVHAYHGDVTSTSCFVTG